MNTQKVFQFIMAFIVAFAWAGIPMPVTAQGPVPHIWVDPSVDFIAGGYWPAEVIIQITINDPATLLNPDFITNLTTDASGNFYYYSTAFDIQVGFSVFATDGVTIKQVSISNFAVTSVDWIADTVTGVGTPNASASLWTMNPDGQVSFVVDGTGNWEVDLSGIVDITSESKGHAVEFDINNDGTQSNWEVPKVELRLYEFDQDIIIGYGWPVGNTVNLAIDDPATPLMPDYSSSQISEKGDWGRTEVSFSLVEFDLRAGYLATMTDGTMEKTHAVLPVNISVVDFTADTVRGTADPGSDVKITIWCFESPVKLIRFETSDSIGNWTADFSVSGDQEGEQGTFDFKPTQHEWDLQVNAYRYDDDSDATRFRKEAFNPTIVAYAEDNLVIATDFVPGTEVSLAIDDPDNGVGIDITRNGVISSQHGGWECQWGHCFVFELGDGFYVHAGQLITITDGTHIYSHTVTSLLISTIAHTESIVSGTAEPLSELYLYAWPSCDRKRHVIADATGNWLEDFSIPGDETFEQETCDFNSDQDALAYQRSGEGETWFGLGPNPPPVAFNKSSPANNAANRSTTLTLTWGNSSGATSYEFCYDTSNNETCNGTWTSTGANRSANLPGLAFGTKYYWQVRAKNANGTIHANSGTWWNFTTRPLITKTFSSIGANDGWILESTETSGLGGTMNAAASTLNLGDDAANKQYRAILSFNTSTVPDNAVITKVTLKLKKQGISGGGNPVAMFQGFMVDIKKGMFGAAPLALADFKATANKTVGPSSPALVAGWYNLNLTPAKAYVNKLATGGGLTQIRLRFKLDDNNNAIANTLNVASGNNAAATNRPTLIIEYYVP